MFEDDQWQQQNDLLEREQRAMDCLMVCHKHGLEGTANELAAQLGLSKQWKQAKEQNAPRLASVG
jgi:hypothetical protein